jgi:hypothetical protein
MLCITQVNHVCAFVDAAASVSASVAVQACGPAINPSTLQPYPGDRVRTVNPTRASIQNDTFENYGMGILRAVGRSNSSGIAQEALLRSSGGAVGEAAAPSAQSGRFVRSNSGASVGGSGSVSRSGEDSALPHQSSNELRTSTGSGSNRPSVAFTQPLTQGTERQDTAQPVLSTESEDAFFPTEFPPSAGLAFGSRNSSVNSTYGNDSDTSSAYGDAQRSTLANMLNVDLGLSKFFSFK